MVSKARKRIKSLESLTKDELKDEDSSKENVKFLTNEDGSVDVDFDIESDSEDDVEFSNDLSDNKGHYKNLVEDIDPEVLQEIGQTILTNVETDENDRSEWMTTIEFGLDLLGIRVEEKQEPFKGACSAQHPLLMESAVKFQSKASNELLPANGPVKTKVLGDSTLEKEEQANRVKKHLNYQLTEEMTEFYTDSERNLLYVPLVGSGFKKIYYDGRLKRPVSEFVPADQVVVPNQSSDLFRAPRYTHILYKSEFELEEDFAYGLYEKPDESVDPLPEPSSPKLTDVQLKTNALVGVEIGMSPNNDVYTIYEQYIDYHIEGIDKYKGKEKYKLASPYIITVESTTGKVLGVRRNWKKKDEDRIKRMQFVHFQFVPGFGFYGLGYLHLLGNLQLSLTSSLRSLVDAGQFANLQGGFKLKGVRIVDDGDPIMPGQFKDLEAMTQDIHKAIMPLPFKEPSQVLFQMLEFLDVKGQKFADSTEQVIADATNYGPVGTTMALLDASTKFFAAIHKRLHASLKQELKAISFINSETLKDNTEYNLENESMKISRKDYDDRVDIVPVSDPNISSNAHRLAKAQTLLQIAQQNPTLHDMRAVLKHVYINMDYPDIDKILPNPEEAQQSDPLTDIQNAQQGRPIKAFQGQDHLSHIAIKKSFISDPFSGGNSMMQKVSLQIQANIQEHMLLHFLEQTQAVAQQDKSPIEQAASKVAQLNQQKLEQDQSVQGGSEEGKAAILLAQAEMLDTQTGAKRENFEEKFKVAELELKKEKIDLDILKELRMSEEFDKKQAQEVSKLVNTKALEAMVQALDKEPPSDGE